MMIDGAFRFPTALNLDTSLVSNQTKCAARLIFQNFLKSFVKYLKKIHFFIFTANT